MVGRLGAAGEYLIHRGRGLALHGRRDVAVDAESHGRIRVPEAFRDDPDVRARPEHQRRGGVA